MFVESLLMCPPGVDAKPHHRGQPAYTGMVDWHGFPMGMHDESGAYGGALPTSKLSNGPCPFAWRADGICTLPDKEDQGSDASTADPSPDAAEDSSFMNLASLEVLDTPWQEFYSHALPPIQMAAFGHVAPWQPEWDASENMPNMAQQAALPSASALPPGLFSLGSSTHHFGQCKPCAHIHKPEGCQSGAECVFCHLCPPNEKQRRKRAGRRIERQILLNFGGQ